MGEVGVLRPNLNIGSAQARSAIVIYACKSRHNLLGKRPASVLFSVLVAAYNASQTAARVGRIAADTS